MALPRTPGSDTTAIDMQDLEAGKKRPSITIQSIDSPSERPVLGRRKTSGHVHGLNPALDRQLGYEGEEDTLTKVGNFLWKIHNASIITRYALYIIPIAALLAIPVALFATIYADRKAVNIRLLGLFIWIEVVWVGLWICKLIAAGLPPAFQAASGVISAGLRKYSLVLDCLQIQVSLFLWSILAFATTNLMESETFKVNELDTPWLTTLKLVFKAGIIVAAIFLAEKTFVQLVSINYHRKQYDAKIKESKKLIRLLDLLYDSSRAIFPEYCREFQAEDADIQGNTLSDVRAALGQAGIKTKVFNDMGRVRDKVTAAFGAMASDITGKQVFSATSAHSIVIEALETEKASKALARRIWLSFVGEGKDVLFKRDLIEVLGHQRSEEAEEIFHILDRDGNGDVSLEEMTMLVVSIGQERKNRAASMHDISQAIAVLDRLLSAVVLVAIAFVYATIFSKTFASKTSQMWTTFTGVGFAIGGTVTEFLACCTFLFVKHPYDVGDRVNINDNELIVEHISLMYSVFRRVDSDAKVQIPHNIANTLWIENVSRSNAQKERLSLNVSPSTSMEDILALRSELANFVNQPENKRHFQSDIDIELRNLNDLTKLELRVEIRHKSNFSNEQLRNARRNNFMVELLAACRRIPIDPPGGSAPALGDPSNPSYSVAISDREAAASRAAHDVAVKEKRLFQVGEGMKRLIPEGLPASATGLQNPAAAMMAGLTGRKLGGGAEGRRSVDSRY